MYIVNTSFFVEPQAQTQWLRIITRDYIPLLRQRGFSQIKLVRVLQEQPAESFTYALMVHIDDLQRYAELTEDIFGEYLTIATPLFGERVMWHTSLMKDVEDI